MPIGVDRLKGVFFFFPLPGRTDSRAPFLFTPSRAGEVTGVFSTVGGTCYTDWLAYQAGSLLREIYLIVNYTVHKLHGATPPVIS